MYLPTLGRFLSRDPSPKDGEPDVLYGPKWVQRNIQSQETFVAALRRPKLPKTVTSTLDCPGYGCKSGQCSFKLSFAGRVFPDGSAPPGVRICFEQSPGEYIPPEPKDQTICQSEINRSLGKTDHLTIELDDGTVCKYTEPDFPKDAPWPPIPGRLNRKCSDIIRLEDIDPDHPPKGPLKGGCFVTTDVVKSISLRMTMEIGCYCTPCKGFANYDSLKLEVSTK